MVKKKKETVLKASKKEDFKFKIMTQLNMIHSPLRYLLKGTTVDGPFTRNILTCSEFRINVLVEPIDDEKYNIQFVEYSTKEYNPEGLVDLSDKAQLKQCVHVLEQIVPYESEIMFYINGYHLRHKDYAFYVSPYMGRCDSAIWNSLRKSNMDETHWRVPKFDFLLEASYDFRKQPDVCYHNLYLTQKDIESLQAFDLPQWLRIHIGSRFFNVFKNIKQPSSTGLSPMSDIMNQLTALWDLVPYNHE